VRAEPCIVYYDEYIDCKIKAPRMIQAINNRLKYDFHFEERRLPFVDIFFYLIFSITFYIVHDLEFINKNLY
jgi:hypothetical protein